ncbi:MAG: hypothetical protein HYZ11_16135 [Candidatus Tectomicrobia bacterium]|uniref:Uncharacterized protein n=1 Tax=Tectimicrobiota bacterium TaxID=2528274 RepID=A0A932I0M1_UNCTE|nr:hypothetical protein [Candidatus Tectomicrobia bacterium]
MSPPSETVYYSRRKLVWWCFGLSALWACLFGLFYVNVQEGRMAEKASLAGESRAREQEIARLRAENRTLEDRAAKLQGRTAELSEKLGKLAPAEPVMEEQLFPLGTAVEIVPGRLFLTAARIEGERVRLRLAAIAAGGADLGTRSLPPGEPWTFTFAEGSYTLLVHELSSQPPGAKISVRKNPAAKP